MAGSTGKSSQPAASAATDCSAALSRVYEIEERIRQLEIEKRLVVSSVGGLPPRTPTASPGSVGCSALSPDLGQPQGGGEHAGGQPSGGGVSGGVGGGGAGGSGAGRASNCCGLGASECGGVLSIADFSPEWDAVGGGAKMLLTAETMEGCRYVALFGSASVQAEVIRPHVLRLRTPPSAGGFVGSVPLQLLRLAPDGTVAERSAAVSFSYRTLPSFGPSAAATVASALAASSSPPWSPPCPSATAISTLGCHVTHVTHPGLLPSPAISPSGLSPTGAISPPSRPVLPTGWGAAPSNATSLALGWGGRAAGALMTDDDDLCFADDADDGSAGQVKEELGMDAEDDEDPDDLDDELDEDLLAFQGKRGAGVLQHASSHVAEEESKSEVFAMALSLTTQPEVELERHFRNLLSSLDGAAAPLGGSTSRGRTTPSREVSGDVDQRLRRLQQFVRARLIKRGLPIAAVPDGRHQELISQVQRSFRNRRLNSRRRAALAIERFYLKRRREPYRSPSGRSAVSALCAGEMQPLMEDDMPHQDRREQVARSDLLAAVTMGDAGAQGAAPEQLQLIRATQAAFRARQHRKKAVRVIEQAYGDWKFHAEQVGIGSGDAS